MRFVALLLMVVVVSLPKRGEIVEVIREVTDAAGGDRVKFTANWKNLNSEILLKIQIFLKKAIKNFTFHFVLKNIF